MSQSQTSEKTRPLRIGARVTLWGTLSGTCKVVSYRIGRQGLLYRFRSEEDLEDTTEGYIDMVHKVLER